ncbi:MAG TPA: ComEC/Rec2 family competence protein, partial [Microthrixaceae bacterium]|nr:ComEC/Rec2 family competence protein [Microthrixaceae bacterium]
MADATWHRGSRAEEGGEGVTGDLAMVVSAAAVAAVAFTGWHLPTTLTIAGVLALLLAARTIGRSRPGPILLLVLLLITGQHADMSISALDAPLPATVEGTGRLVSDPVVRVFDTQVIVEVDGRRYQASVPLEVAAPLRPLLTGEMVVISGRTQKLEGAPRGWVLSWHLAGRLKVSSIEAGEPSRPWYRLANGLRRIIQRGSSSMEDDQAALYLGLVVGDDRGQSEVLKFRFGASGLTHLLAVSGQNVAFLLSVAAPLLNRMGTRSKLFAAGAMLA